jgi:hypothetical protein
MKKSCSTDTCWSLLGVYDDHQKITSYNVNKKKSYDLMTKFLEELTGRDFLLSKTEKSSVDI